MVARGQGDKGDFKGMPGPGTSPQEDKPRIGEGSKVQQGQETGGRELDRQGVNAEWKATTMGWARPAG